MAVEAPFFDMPQQDGISFEVQVCFFIGQLAADFFSHLLVAQAERAAAVTMARRSGSFFIERMIAQFSGYAVRISRGRGRWMGVFPIAANCGDVAESRR